ncbi:MAG TPA: hypothetical protein P5050_04870 [Bacteroidia bacterium]|nr:hypothetical protein [Bacteroidia bacterium]HRS58535.1 hypothetical protein [Bacteroidia bacterium]
MAITSITYLSSLTGINRIDSEYFKPSYLELENILNKVKTIPITRIAFTSDGNHMSISKYFTDTQDGIPYYRGQDINDFFLHNATPYRIKREIYEKAWMHRSHFKIGDVLLSIVGTVGSLSYVSNKIKESTGSCKIAIIRPKNNVDGRYIAAFLKSKYGQFQILRNIRGAVQTGLILKDMVFIRIPEISHSIQNKISTLVQKAIDENYKSKTLYTQATQLLEEALGLDKIEFKREKCYTASFSEVINKNRIDGEHYQPKYKQIKKLILNYKYGWESFLQNVKYITPNFDPKKSPNTPFNYIELSDVNPTLGTIGDIQPILGKDAPSRAKRLVSEGDVIASSVVGSVDKAALITSNENGFLASTGFFHFRSSYYSPEFLLLLVKSILFKEQLFQESTGGILSAVPDQNLKHIIIPCLSNELKNEITELVKRSHQYHKQSKQLLEQAKQEVETLIEQAAKKNE